MNRSEFRGHYHPPASFQVYSVVNGVANVYLLVKQENMNEVLVEQGFAEFNDENYMSKVRCQLF